MINRSRTVDIFIIAGFALLIGVITGFMVERYTRAKVVDAAFDRMRLFHDLRKAAVEDFMRHCQTNLNGPSKGAGLRRSGRQLTPFSERGSAVLFEDIAAVEVAVLVEVVVD